MVNELISSGTRAQTEMFSFLNNPESSSSEAVPGIQSACQDANIEIITGHTPVLQTIIDYE